MAESTALVPLALPPTWPPQLALAVSAWLAEIGQGSPLTRRAYESALGRFVIALDQAGLTLASPAGHVKIVAERWSAAGDVGPATRNKLLSILSSFYRYAIMSELLPPPNPIERITRPRWRAYARARGLEVSMVKRKLAAIDRSTLGGLRDYALLSVALTTGRRLSELAGLRWQHVHLLSNGQAQLTWARTKGGDIMYDTLPMATTRALTAYLYKLYGPQLGDLPHDAPVWVSLSNHQRGRAISISAIADVCQRRIGTSKVHQLRHTFAQLMEDKGAKVSEIQQRLGHVSAATTAIYLQALRSDENRLGEVLAEALGVE